MRLFADNNNVVFPALRVELQNFLTARITVCQSLCNLPHSRQLLHKCDSNHAQTHDDNLLPL